MDKIAQHKKVMIQALTKTLGIVTDAVKIANISRSQYYNWLREDPAFAKEVADISDIAVDFAESKLHANIEKGDTTSIIFYLKTKGKSRGYTERQEIDHSGGVTINIPPIKWVDGGCKGKQ